jgi:outer membrane protein assembly factor BamB
MMRNWKVWNRVAFGLALAGLALAAVAQSGDWRTYAGDNQRSGHNALPTSLWGPGRSNLIWWRPNAADLAGQTFVLDNLPLTINGSPFSASFSGAWGAPATVSDEAFNPFLPVPYSNSDPAANPSYRYAFTTESSATNPDPTVPLNAANLRVAEWQFDFSAFGDATPRNYALHVWLPIGATTIGGIARYQQRFWVYEILYGTGQRWIDVVDAYAAGTGWVRLGNGGRATNRIFDYDGATPIRIRLYNTVPRNESGGLSDTPGTTLVYADAAMAAPDLGYYRSSPIVSEFGPGGLPSTHVVTALNRVSQGTRGRSDLTVTKGEVISYLFNSASGANNTRWVYEILANTEDVTFLDNSSAGVTVNPAWLPQVLPATFFGANYVSALTTNNAALATDVVYAPTLEDGDYEIWAWFPGSAGGINFAQSLLVEVQEGAAVTPFTVNQDTARGWVRIGSTRFDHTSADPLRLRITNFSSDPADVGRFAYADAVRFVGATNLAVHSTPVQVDALVRLSPGGPLVSRSVTLAAAENGRIYCLDSQGNGDGTTTCLWTYPSTPDPNNSSWTDPNQVSGEDGQGPIAEMPSGFDLSSALVQRIGGEDYLFIGSSNGRVYCIEMAGRGDMNLTLQIPGTTRRRWSYPNDYPSRALPGNLGPIEGSVLYANTSQGDTIFVPTSQGRLYALDALGNAASKTTTARWAFPPLNQQNLGSIVGTPALAFGNVYFGTQVRGGDDRGRFFAVNQNTGAGVWEFNGTTAWSSTGAFVRADDFNSGPVTIPSSEMAGMPNTVVVANDNRWLSALQADTGALLWTTDEMEGTVIGNLTFTHQTVFNNAGVLAPAPVVVAPVSDGTLMSFFAEASRTNVFGSYFRLAWGFETAGALTAQAAVGRNWMYANDEAGYIYGFNDSAGGPISPGPPPGQNVITPNDPAGFPLRSAKIKFVNRDTYDRLRQVTGSGNHLSRAQALQAAREITRVGFEWGETIYALVYDIPYILDETGATLPVQANFRFSVEGAAVRNISVQAKQFSSPGASPSIVDPNTGTSYLLDGYAITSFTIQGSGATALPPGNAFASFTISAQFTAGGRMQNVAINPATSRRPFAIANPIGLAMRTDASGNVILHEQIGWTNDPDSPGAAVNGSPDLSATPGNREDLLLSSAGIVAHGQPANTSYFFVDRSMMYLLRGPGRGLDNVRVSRSDLAWQGGAGAVWKPIDQLRYPGTEQLPINFPNDSLDYPNLLRENIRVTKDPFGNAENPLYGGVSLTPPVPGADPNDPLQRTLVLTPVDTEVGVPKFQPANLSTRPDSTLVNRPAGYYGQMQVYVDSTGNAQLDRRGRREASRSYWLSTSVDVDERIIVDTPVVDLGSLAQGAGYSPIAPYGAGSPFSPWGGPYQSFFRPFQVRNEGNVNLLNLRLAKGTVLPSGQQIPWGLWAPANHERSFMDTWYSLWSDIDATYALNFGGSNSVLLQKARPGDRSGTTLSTNPIRRENAFLGVGQGPVGSTSSGYPEPAQPRVAVSAPIGTPVGSYTTTLRVIEDRVNADQAMQVDASGNSLEPYSDPTLAVRFNVRESRVTNHYTPGTAPFVDNGLTGGEPFLHKNVQPTGFRDIGGQLVVAYASNQPVFDAPQPAAASTNDQFRIYISTLDGQVPSRQGNNPLRDLLFWNPQGTGRWFRQAAGPLPTQPADTLFASGPGENVLPGTIRYGAPNFPVLGGLDPFSGAPARSTLMAFLGTAEKQTPSGRVSESRIILQGVGVSGTGMVSLTGPWVMGFDPTTGKGRPAIVQAGSRATVVYAGSGTGTNALFHSHFDGAAFGQPQPLPLGNGFESFGTPSVSARAYRGLDQPDLAAGTAILELTFTGKLRGRAHAEVYLARLRSNSSVAVTNVPGTRSPLVYLPRRNRERLTAEGEAGTYWASGLLWNANDPAGNPIVVEQRRGAAIENLEVPNTREYDAATGRISFDTRLGGKAYVDTESGMVRFSGTLPSRDATILLSYTPKILRISQGGGAAYAGPTGIWDNRLTGEFSPFNAASRPAYWANRLGTAAAQSDPIRMARYVFTYGRAAAGSGSAARPFLRTMRLGVQLPTAILTNPNGTVAGLTVTGMANTATSFYQVDPANGRVYFTDENENRPLTIQYQGVDAGGAPTGPISVEVVVTLIGERSEAPVPIEQAVNESQLFSFVDPLDPLSPPERRPGLIWMVFTSTRAGGPDVYIQSIAPNLSPVATGRD